MREVAVIGIGQTEISEHWDKSLRELAGDAVLKAMANAGLDYFDGLYVGNMMSASANNQQQLGAYIADWVGQKSKEAYRLESACSSGAAAFRAALIAVASGEIDVAVAVGVEKMTDSPSAEITASLATAADADWEVSQGVSFVALNALIMQRYLHEYGWKRSDFANFSINAHANAMHNPYARFHMLITQKQFEEAGVICDPITLLDASPIGDGAAAALLVPVEKLAPLPNKSVIRVAGSGAASDTIAVHARKDPLWLTSAERSSKDAYRQASIDQYSIDFFEYHDAFTIMAALSLEASGFAERGQGPRLALDNEIRKGGKIPVATLGGLKARGHPVGATGMYQIAEVVTQLRGQAGEAQIDGARWGMAQNIGGSGSNIITHILTNAD
ncbi:MAG: thiolase domain-containing protein [Pelolinea sp.]|nr:thiolase domain-containing protein [Pelolinea sp.]